METTMHDRTEESKVLVKPQSTGNLCEIGQKRPVVLTRQKAMKNCYVTEL